MLTAALVQLPARDLSPFGHVPELPAGSFEPVPVLVLPAIAAALTWAGLMGPRRRDVPVS